MLNADLNRFGSMIRAVRTDRHLTQEQLAEAAGITKKYVSGIENGKNNLSYSVLCRLVSALQLPAESIFYPSADGVKNNEDRFLSNFRRCPEKDRDFLLCMTSHLVDELNRKP